MGEKQNWCINVFFGLHRNVQLISSGHRIIYFTFILSSGLPSFSNFVLQNDVNYPYLDVLEELVTRGRPLPVRLDLLPQMESQVAAARAWKDRTSKIFVKKGSTLPLFEVLLCSFPFVMNIVHYL